MASQVIVGHVLDVLREWPDEWFQCCVTSPPYWGLRDYKVEPVKWGEGDVCCLGLEPTPELYVQHIVQIFREVRRVLKRDGTCWVNLGDSYASQGHQNSKDIKGEHLVGGGLRSWGEDRQNVMKTVGIAGLKPKDLIGIPWRVAFALQADGWWLRSDIIWSKPNPMPESVTDRPTKAHEYLFLLAKSQCYFWDQEAIRESQIGDGRKRGETSARTLGLVPGQLPHHKLQYQDDETDGKRNRRTVWTIATQPYKEAHFATFPEELVEPCVLAGARANDWVLDPFIGSGTTAAVCEYHKRNCIGIDVSHEYRVLAEERIAKGATKLAKRDAEKAKVEKRKAKLIRDNDGPIASVEA